LLIEQIETDEGNHLFVYPFEGRLVHEAMAAILAYRISRITPITFSFAMNDYGFELLSDHRYHWMIQMLMNYFLLKIYLKTFNAA
jgi:Lhr-like helicase